MIGELNYVDAFLVVFIGMGPLKALVAYLSATHGASKDVQKRVARKMVFVALILAVGIVLLGVALMQILHFSIGSLRIAGGIILLLLSIRMVIGGGGHDAPSDHGPVDEAELMRQAISPLAIPLLLNPIGIVSFTVFSTQVTQVLAFGILVAMIVVVAVIDYLILANAHRADDVLTAERIMVAEKILGIFLAALSVQLILNGLAEVGAITLSSGH
jgi:multiple antibiotic resistance protein